MYERRSSILAVLDHAITVGHLTISDSEGTHYYGKYQKGCNDVHLNVINDTFWLKILMLVSSQISELISECLGLVISAVSSSANATRY